MSSNIAPDAAARPASSTEAPQKLKSSCDACSASKVRCESQKPVCSRCANMGHPCSYSAARRVGRRHGAYAKKRAPAEPRYYPDLLPSSHITAATNVAGRRPSSTPSLSTTSSSRASQEDSGGGGSGSTSLPRLEPQLPGKPTTTTTTTSSSSSSSSSTSSSSFSSPSSSSLFSSAAADQGRKYPALGGDPRDSASHGERAVRRGLAPHAHQHQQQPVSNSDSLRQGLPDLDMDAVINCLGGSGPNNIRSRADSFAGPGGHPLPVATDCAGSAMAVQEQLEATNDRLRLLPGGGGTTPEDLVASDLLGTACDRLATVLVCPCSAQVGTGLLVAAACISMLEVYGALLLVGTDDSNGALPQQTWGAPDYFSLSGISGASRQGRRASLAAGEQRVLRGRQGEAAMRIMETLPGAASLILQFAKRYKASDSTATLRGSCAVAPGSSELLYALASYLRVRLQTLTSEATGQLQCASWAGGI